MTTPLGLARQLRLSFAEFIEVKIVRDEPYTLRAYCALAKHDRLVSDERLNIWRRDHIACGSVLLIEQSTTIPPSLFDEEALLRRTRVPRIVAESASTTGPGLRQTLRALFPDEFIDLDWTSTSVNIHVAPHVPIDRDEILCNSVRLLMPFDTTSLVVSRQPSPKVAAPHNASPESRETLKSLSVDIETLTAELPTLFSSKRLDLPALPKGSATYGTVHDGVESLMQRLALFDRVYMYMPFSTADFANWVGASFEDFIDLLPTGRVIPVFAQSLDRYEPGLMSTIVDAGTPRVMHRGEHTLRLFQSFALDHPDISLVGSDAGAQLRAALDGETDPRAVLYATYYDALTQIVARMPAVAIAGQSLATALFPLAEWLDKIRRQVGLLSRDLEMVGALEHRAASEAVGGVPMSQIGNYLDSALMFIYGAEPGSNEILRVPDPEIIGRICFPDTKGLSPRQFADSFKGAPVDAMRTLMASQRVQTADGCTDLVRQFNTELIACSARPQEAYTAVAILLTVIGVFALSAPTAIAGLAMELAKQVIGRKAPGAMATFTSRTTGGTREAALLARIRRR